MSAVARALLTLLVEQSNDAVLLRHALHRRPSRSGREGPTRDMALAYLAAHTPNLAVSHVAGTGAVVRIGPPTGPCVAVRAEMDALPLAEQTGAAFAAESDPDSPELAAHACGHDVHVAAAVALARAAGGWHTGDIAAGGAGLPLALLLVLQPREEAFPSGAADIVASGVLGEHGTTAVVGAHVQPQVTPGLITTTAGGVNASSDEFTITVHGVGGHGAYPHTVADPVLAITAVVQALLQITARRSNPLSPTVLTVGSLHAGSAPNVIPDRAVARGTVRSLVPNQRFVLHEQLRQVAMATAIAWGCTATVEMNLGEPVLNNDPVLARAAARGLLALGLSGAPDWRSCGADDFSFYADAGPALMMFVGVDGSPPGHPAPGVAERPGLHSPRFLPPDSAVGLMSKALLVGFGAGAGWW